MNKKRLIIIAGVVIAMVTAMAVGYFFFSKSDEDIPVNIISKDNKITLKDMQEYFKSNQFMSGDEHPNQYFVQSIANPNTVKFFKYLQMQIKANNLEEHLKAVEKYLQSVMEPAKAAEMFALYKKFCDYEIEMTKNMQKLSHPKNADELIRYLQEIHQYRREIFGAEIADAMWGIEVKGQEYNIRKGSILHNGSLYGIEKEKQLSALKDEMWGTGPESVEEPPQTDPEKFSRFQEKQLTYQRDLNELPDTDRREKIKEFRKEYFSSEQITRLEQVDQEMENNKKNESDYYAQEKDIMNNPSLDNEKKAEMIRDLQNQTFGEEAEAFRRRLNIQRNIK